MNPFNHGAHRVGITSYNTANAGYRMGKSKKSCFAPWLRYVLGFHDHVLGRGSLVMRGDSPLVRQWVLLRTLSARRYGVTVQEMAQEAGVTDKTVRRDLQTFQQAGFCLEQTVGDHGRKSWRINCGGEQAGISFALDEALALYLGRQFLEPLAGTIFWTAAQSAFHKIRACLNKSALDYLDKIAAHLHHTSVGAGDYAHKAELVDNLVRGIEELNVVHIEYQSLRSTEPVTYEICPYGLSCHRGSLYLIAHSREHNEIRNFKVDRIEKADVSRFPFHLPAGFNLQEYMDRSFGVYQGKGDVRVKVNFLPAVARYVLEGRWHASQRLVKQPDGSILADFRLSDTEEIKHWILSFGSNAIVTEPASLRAEIVSEAAVILASYNATGAGPADGKLKTQ